MRAVLECGGAEADLRAIEEHVVARPHLGHAGLIADASRGGRRADADLGHLDASLSRA